MAAHLEGKGATVLDVTGLAQKNGAVMSHVRIARAQDELYAVRVGAGGADLLLGCDLITAASPAALRAIRPGITKAVVKTHVQPTAAFVFEPDIEFDSDAMLRAIAGATGEDGTEAIDATALARALMGDAIADNMFMLGYVLQKGLLPLGVEAIERAVELNGIAVENNKRAIAWGRLAAHDRAQVRGRTSNASDKGKPRQAPSLAAEVERRAEFLADYQNDAYAQRYRDTIAMIEAAEKTRARGCSGLAIAAARNLFKLMAYKDEYEVARLYSDAGFRKRLHDQFGGDFKLQYHLAPPFVAARDPATGELRKHAFGAWMMGGFKLLARLRRLRGTPFDVFGYTRERRMERELIAQYEALLRNLATTLSPANHALAVEIAPRRDQTRGFGHSKMRNIEQAKTREAELLALWQRKDQPATAA